MATLVRYPVPQPYKPYVAPRPDIFTGSPAPPAQVTFDALGPNSGGAFAAGGSSSLTWAHTNSGNALVVGVTVATAADSGITVTATYAGTTMTPGALVECDPGLHTGYLRIFTLMNPAAGANNVVATLAGGTSEILGGSISASGVASFVTQYSNSGTATPATATSAGSTSGGLIAAFVGNANGIISTTAPSTSRIVNNQDTGTSAGNLAAATSPSTGSNVTTAWTVTFEWAVIGVEMLPGGAIDPGLGVPQRIRPGSRRQVVPVTRATYRS